MLNFPNMKIHTDEVYAVYVGYTVLYFKDLYDVD